MAFVTTISLTKLELSEKSLSREGWEAFIKGFTRGVVSNLGGVWISYQNKERTVQAILEKKYEQLDELDIVFIHSLFLRGKLYLGAFGSFTTLVNVANAVFDSRRASAIPIPTHRVKTFSALASTPFRMLKSLSVGKNPTLRRGDSYWDPGLLDAIVRIIRENFHADMKRIAEFRFDCFYAIDRMYVELTWNGRFAATFVGKPLELNPAIILAIAIAGFDDQLRAMQSGEKTVVKETKREVKLEDL